MGENTKRTALDRILLTITVSTLLAGLAVLFLGVYALAKAVL